MSDKPNGSALVVYDNTVSNLPINIVFGAASPALERVQFCLARP